jgi:hypothetical protein
MILRGILAVAFGFIILVSARQTIEGSPTSIPTVRAIPNIALLTRTLPILAQTDPSEWQTQDSYQGDCNATPPGTVCVTYSDGYIWLVPDTIVGWAFEGTTIEIVRGSSADYYHILGTLLVRTVSNSP